MTWALKNTITGEVMSDHKHTFEDLYHEIDSEMQYFIDSILIKGNKRTVRAGVRKLKENNEILVFQNLVYWNAESPNVWQYMRPKLIDYYLNHKYDNTVQFLYKRLFTRFSGHLENKFVVKVANQTDLSSLGLIYVSAKILDPTISPEIIILTQDQLNYLKLAYPENTVWHVTDVNKVLKDLKDIGLVEEAV